MSFTITLTTYNHVAPFDLSEFTQLYPDSMITTVITESKEENIEITNPLVTPQILQLLQEIITTRKYPYVNDTNHPVRKALRYLCIVLPDFIYDPSYEEYLKDSSKPNLFGLGDLNLNYETILNRARNVNFPALAKYLFQQTKADLYQGMDHKMFMDILESPIYSSSDQEIACLILTQRQIQPVIEYNTPTDITLSPHIQDLTNRIILKAYINLFHIWWEKYSRVAVYRMPAIFQRIGMDPEHIRQYAEMNQSIIHNLPILIEKIGMDPEHISQYVEMIRYLHPHLNKYYENTYRVFLAVYTGDIPSFDNVSISPIPTTPLGNGWVSMNMMEFLTNHPMKFLNSSGCICGLMWTSLLTNHLEMFHKLVTTYGNRKMLRQFLTSYIGHPRCIHPEHLPQVARYMNKTVKKEGIKHFRTNGYTHLAEILRNT